MPRDSIIINLSVGLAEVGEKKFLSYFLQVLKSKFQFNTLTHYTYTFNFKF